jgi:CheY-like chemotaxis protein
MTTDPAKSAPSCAAPCSSGGVLVVEDDPCSRDVMVRLLKMLGYSARPAGDGFAALEEARQSRPGLVLMDLSLPGIDGLETIRRFRTDPALAAVPAGFRHPRSERPRPH